ncbi:MAG: hypothetical protein WED81_08145 [Rhodothermales bacterium]
MHKRLQLIHDRWKAFAETKRGIRTVKATRLSFFAIVVSVLIYQISGIGWASVFTSLPESPFFYVLLLAMYFLLPATEATIYGRLWDLPPRECFPVMIRKRVLNVDVVGYSGEIYLFVWAKNRVKMASRRLMGVIKDNLILSSAASLSAAAILIAGLLATEQIAIDAFAADPSPYYAGLIGFAVFLVAALALRFRDALFTLPTRVLGAVGAAHLVRFLVGYVLQVAQWWIVLPSAPFESWATLLVLFVVINRIPFLPSSDLVFVSAGVGLTPLLGIPVAPVVSMLIVRSAADRLLNLGFFAGSVWFERRAGYSIAEPANRADDELSDEKWTDNREIAITLKS